MDPKIWNHMYIALCCMHYPRPVFSPRCGALPSALNLPSRTLDLPSRAQQPETEEGCTVRDALWTPEPNRHPRKARLARSNLEHGPRVRESERKEGRGVAQVGGACSPRGQKKSPHPYPVNCSPPRFVSPFPFPFSLSLSDLGSQRRSTAKRR